VKGGVPEMGPEVRILYLYLKLNTESKLVIFKKDWRKFKTPLLKMGA